MLKATRMSGHVYRSVVPDIEIPSLDLVQFLFPEQSSISDDRVIYVDSKQNEQRTYGAIKLQLRRLSNAFRKLGIKEKDVVVFFSPNGIDYAVTCLAIIGCGATVSPANSASNSAELRSQLETSGAHLLLAHSSLLQVARSATEGNPSIKIVQADGTSSFDGSSTIQQLAQSTPPAPLTSIDPAESESRLAFMCFSSGTTGKSKGVMSTHRNMISAILLGRAHRPDDFVAQTSVAFLPFSHIYGLWTYVLIPIFCGHTVIVMPRFELPLFLELAQKYRPQSQSLVPPIILLLAKHELVTKYDLKSIKSIHSAAAPLSPELAMETEQRFKKLYGTNMHIEQTWGATETSPIITTTFSPNLASRYGIGSEKRFTVGSICANCELRLVDPITLNDIPHASRDDGSDTASIKQTQFGPGELWVSGPNVAAGYFKNESATKESFIVEHIGGKTKRWWRTGDIGTIDQDGFVRIVDRIKEMIKYKGFQVIPSELEGKLLEHDRVVDACVVGRYQESIATEVPVGFVVLKRLGESQDEADGSSVVEDLQGFINARVAGYKRLRGGLFVVDAIPKSATGKILRREVKQWLDNGKFGSGADKKGITAKL